MRSHPKSHFVRETEARGTLKEELEVRVVITCEPKILISEFPPIANLTV